MKIDWKNKIIVLEIEDAINDRLYRQIQEVLENNMGEEEMLVASQHKDEKGTVHTHLHLRPGWSIVSKGWRCKRVDGMLAVIGQKESIDG